MKKLPLIPLFLTLAGPLPTEAAVTLPFGTATLVNSYATATTVLAPPNFSVSTVGGTFSLTFRVDASQDVYLSRGGLTHSSGFGWHRPEAAPGIYEDFFEAAPERTPLISVTPSSSDTADWLFVTEGSSRTFQLIGRLPERPEGYGGDYLFYLNGLRWSESLSGTGLMADFGLAGTFATPPLAIFAAPEPGRATLALLGAAVLAVRRRRRH